MLQKSLAGAVGLGLGLRGQPLVAEAAIVSRARAREDTRFSEVLRITPDNRIILVPPVAEMGQNVITSLAALVAEELEVDWSRVEVEIAPHHPDFYNVRGQAAGNSRAVRIWYEPLRQLGAAARMALTEAAAQRWRSTGRRAAGRGGAHHRSGQRQNRHLWRALRGCCRAASALIASPAITRYMAATG